MTEGEALFVFVCVIVLIVACCAWCFGPREPGYVERRGYNGPSAGVLDGNNGPSFGVLEGRRFLSKPSTLDLHGLSSQGARYRLDTFFDDLRHQRGSCHILTGRGAHSFGGQPVLKPMVEEYLDDRGYSYVLVNPGMFKVYLRG